MDVFALIPAEFSQVLHTPFEGKPLGLWLVFIGMVGILLVLDLGVFNRKDHEIGVRESLTLSAFYVLVSIVYGLWVWHHFGPEKGGQFFTGYVIEKSLSLDNIFVMSLIFSYLAVPAALQHRVLFWGILGVLILRGLMIALGAALIASFHWVLFLLAGFLVVSGVRLLFSGDDVPDIAQNPLLRVLQRLIRITPDLHGHRFFVRVPHHASSRMVLAATPLFVALVLIEVSDILFAVDSVPAIFAITTDPFIVYTSNVMAILGLRALYFALAAILHRFHYLRYALSLVLVFIGGKILASDLFGFEKIPAWISLGITLALLSGGIGVSVLMTAVKPRRSWATVRYAGQSFLKYSGGGNGAAAILRTENDEP